MSDEIMGAWIGVGVALAVGAVGWILAGIANYRAEKANELAETANRIAKDAADQATAANKLAEDANELSEQANTLSGRALQHASDESFVQWLPKWDAKSASITLVNTGRDIAYKPSVVVTGHELHQVGSGDDTAPSSESAVPLPQILEKRANNVAKPIGAVNGNRVMAVRQLIVMVNIVVLWDSKAGFQHSERHEFEIREGKRDRKAIIL